MPDENNESTNVKTKTDDEKHEELIDALLQIAVEIRSLNHFIQDVF